MVERLVLIRTIDSLWVEHLTELDDMRRGIGLRGYAQQDPLNEFRREAFRLYEELRGLIRHGVASSIFRVTVTRGPGPSGNGADPAVGAVAGAGRAPPSRGGAIGRHGARPRPAVAQPVAVAAATAAGSTVLRGGAGGRPDRRCRSASRSATQVVSGPRRARRPGGARPGLHAERRADRAQRSVLVRFGREVQEVSRALSPSRRPARCVAT